VVTLGKIGEGFAFGVLCLLYGVSILLMMATTLGFFYMGLLWILP